MKLTEPAIEYGRQIGEYRREFLESGDSMDGTGGLRRFDDPSDWIGHIKKQSDLQYIFVREEDEKIVGMLQIRPVFNEYLEKYGGHIGYSVAPSERRKGYAVMMLGMALPKCAELGIGRVLVTCDKDNEASRRTILDNGGIYESVVYEPDEGIYVERYWIVPSGVKSRDA